MGVSARPLDDYHGYTTSQGQVTVEGSVRPATQKLGGQMGVPGPMMFNTAPQEDIPQVHCLTSNYNPFSLFISVINVSSFYLFFDVYVCFSL